MHDPINNKLIDIWRKSGMASGDTLLLHSSVIDLLAQLRREFKSRTGPKEVLASLLEALGSKGTLVLPLFNFDWPNTGRFDIRTTPSQMGVLSEAGRRHPDAVRTGHPIYSFAAIGHQAKAFAGVNNISGYGADSPFAIVHQLDGRIGVIGLPDQTSMTSYHYVEEQNLVDYRYFKNFPGQYTDATGATHDRTYKLYVRDLDRGVKTDGNRMMDHLWDIGAYVGDKYNEGYGTRTIRFNTMYDEVERMIQRGEAINYLYSIKKP